MFSFLKKLFGKYDFEPFVKKINSLGPDLEKSTDEELENKSLDLKKAVQEGKSLDDILPEAFALVRETAKRTLNQRPFDVQLIGGIVLHQGKIAEMKTGEGKTLAAVMPAYLNALTGKGAHIITVNDYLARYLAEAFHKAIHGCACSGYPSLTLSFPPARPAMPFASPTNPFWRGTGTIRAGLHFRIDRRSLL